MGERESVSTGRRKGSGAPKVAGADAIVDEARELTIGPIWGPCPGGPPPARNWPTHRQRAETPPRIMVCRNLPRAGSSGGDRLQSADADEVAEGEAAGADAGGLF